MQAKARRIIGRLAITCSAFVVWSTLTVTAHAQTDLLDGVQSRALRSANAKASFGADAWTIRDNGQIALVAAQNDPSGIFAGVQCDPYDPRAHRMIFGVHSALRAGAGQGLSNVPLDKLTVKTTMPSVVSRFDIAPEDRGQSNLAGAIDYIAAYLTPQQYAALSAAQTITIRFAQTDYQFTGLGSAKAIAGLNCRTANVHTAQRLIEGRREEMPQQKLNAWRVAIRSGGPTAHSTSTEAVATTTNHPLNIAANFTIAIGCFQRKLYPSFGADIDTALIDADHWNQAAAFMQDLDRKIKLLEIYRDGRRIRSILFSEQSRRYAGHALSAAELGDLAQANHVIVVGDNLVIEFSTHNLAASLTNLGAICKAGA